MATLTRIGGKGLLQSCFFQRVCRASFEISRDFVTSRGDGPKPPKKPLNSFLFFFNQQREDIKLRNPGITRPQIAKEVGVMYKNLSESERTKLKEDGLKRLAAYQEEYKTFMETLSMEEKDQIVQAAKDRRIKRKKLRQKVARLKECKEMNKPKAPLTGFLWFVSDLRAEGLRIGSATEQARETGEMWRSMSPEEKQVYLDKASSAREVYAEKLEAWETSMMKNGKFHLVRKSHLPKEMKKAEKKPRKRVLKKKVVAKKPKAKRTATRKKKATTKKTTDKKKMVVKKTAEEKTTATEKKTRKKTTNEQ